ncbi:MAG: fibronectin type III domain-containing protein [Oscillospiraceae bacterium]|nr:fibronectin type III domain-containing protein [Oscillospiraceae bacterium]
MYKKITAALLATGMLLADPALGQIGMSMTVVAQADYSAAAASTSEDYEYSLLDDGTIEITDYTGSATELDIPAKIDGYSVTSIGEEAFAECNSLTNVTLPDSLVYIGDAAFFECNNLENISPIPDSVTYIGSSAFEMCLKLADITLPKRITAIYDYTFYGSNLMNITIPDGVTSIGAYAFALNTNLTTITIPASVTSIGAYAFLKCPYLTTVYGVTGSYAEGYFGDNFIAIDSITQPVTPAVTATPGDGKVTFKWDAVDGAERYSLSIYNPDTGKYTLRSSQITKTTYTASALTNGKQYQFLIRAYSNGAWSPYTTADFVKATPVAAKPTNIKATAGDGKVTFTWTGTPDAERYSLSIYNPDTGKYTLRSSQITKTTYTTSKLTNGKQYLFLIRAYSNGAWSPYTTADFVKATPTA